MDPNTRRLVLGNPLATVAAAITAGKQAGKTMETAADRVERIKALVPTGKPGAYLVAGRQRKVWLPFAMTVPATPSDSSSRQVQRRARRKTNARGRDPRCEIPRTEGGGV